MSDITRFDIFPATFTASDILKLEELLEAHGGEQVLVALKLLCDHHGTAAFYASSGVSGAGHRLPEWNQWSRAIRAALATLNPNTAQSAP